MIPMNQGAQPQGGQPPAESVERRAVAEGNPEQAARGVGGVSWRKYGQEELREKLVDLHERIHRGRYRAKPRRRIW